MYAELSAPLSCQLEITGFCNANCQHCYNFWRRDNVVPNQTLTPTEAKAIIRKLGQTQVFDLVITGGEPLIAFDTLTACLKEARTSGLNISMNTNLLLLTEARARELRQLGISHVLTSLMGPDAETHDALAQHPGAFNTLLRKIKIAQDASIKVVANMVVSKKNMHHVKETAYLSHSLGIRKFCATKAGCPGNCHDFSAFALSLAEFREYLRDLTEVGTELHLKVDALEGYPLCGVKDLDAYHFLVGRKCTAGISTITIASNGLVRPCPHLDESFGNIITEDLSTVWERMRVWRQGTFLPGICKNCSLLGICGSGCRMAAKMEHGSLSALDPYCVPKDAEHALQTMRNHQSRMERRQFADTASFSVLPHRTRYEPFGMTVISNKHNVFFLDHSGMKVLNQMQIDKIYSIGDKQVEWGSIDSKRFMIDMEQRGIITLQQ